jgi:hypothetical protein
LLSMMSASATTRMTTPSTLAIVDLDNSSS